MEIFVVNNESKHKDSLYFCTVAVTTSLEDAHTVIGTSIHDILNYPSEDSTDGLENPEVIEEDREAIVKSPNGNYEKFTIKEFTL